MFAQVIQGAVSDGAEVRAAMDRWVREVSPDAKGWLGSTAGVTEDGRFIAIARFESAVAARANSDRAEQDGWWTETSKLFTGEVTWHDSEDIDEDVTGDPDQAGFVQIMQGRGTDPARAREIMNQDSDKWAEYRPDVIASVAVQHEGGAYTMAIYFTSEAAAREGEKKEPPPEIKAQMDELNALSAGEPEFFDLKNPWLLSPA